MLAALLCNLESATPPPLAGGGIARVRRRPQFADQPQPIVGRWLARQAHSLLTGRGAQLAPVVARFEFVSVSQLNARIQVLDELALILAASL